MDIKSICYPAVFHPEENGYSVTVPDFEQIGYGCFSEGDTFAEACSMTTDAIGICVEELLENKMGLPTPSKPEDLAREGQDFIVPVVFDMETYRRNQKTKLVKKTLTIPQWLNDLAEEQNVNFSKVLRNALAEKLNVQL